MCIIPSMNLNKYDIVFRYDRETSNFYINDRIKQTYKCCPFTYDSYNPIYRFFVSTRPISVEHAYIEIVDITRYCRFLIKMRTLMLSERCDSEHDLLKWLCSRAPYWIFMHVCLLLRDY